MSAIAITGASFFPPSRWFRATRRCVAFSSPVFPCLYRSPRFNKPCAQSTVFSHRVFWPENVFRTSRYVICPFHNCVGIDFRGFWFFRSTAPPTYASDVCGHIRMSTLRLLGGTRSLMYIVISYVAFPRSIERILGVRDDEIVVVGPRWRNRRHRRKSEFRSFSD